MSDLRDSATGRKLTWEGTVGAAHVRPIEGPLNTPSNRYIATGSDTAVTFTSAENITEFYIVAMSTAGTPDETDHINMVVDAPDATIAATWLTKSSSASVSSQIFQIPAGRRVGPFTGVSYFSRLDFSVDGASTAYEITVEAA